ncbi:Aste57867_11555 [Aphanomyces stellatus]|uniref:Aste57867_11555 protein n=1 Tax=Aphanomyces stellatus TaxID=120398 RepID=A0A485KTA9_9STRA|nr:hypothetical protein As57867_011512 [Aphanomyces stellatus]VFT88414.1 Aste57867_11555 [Aphanomyces stellatus]
MATFVGHRSIATLNGVKKLQLVKEINLNQVSPTPKKSVVSPPKQPVSLRDIVVRSVEPCVTPNAAYVEYEVEMANQKSGLVWTIRRRFSKFLELQQGIDALFESTHCAHCSEFIERVQDLELPPKRWALASIWGYAETDTKLRARMFHVYLNELLQLGASKVYRQCSIVSNAFFELFLTYLIPTSIYLELKKVKLRSPPSIGKVAAEKKAVPLRRKSSDKFKALETIFEQQDAPMMETIVC